MIKTWTYNGVAYHSEWQVRQEVFNKDHVSFGEAPEEGKIEFWAQFGVVYAETPEPEPTPEEAEAKRLEEAKRVRAAKVEAITVEVDGMVFDGNEPAQSRMTRAIAAFHLFGIHHNLAMKNLLLDTLVEVVGYRTDKHSLRKPGNLMNVEC